MVNDKIILALNRQFSEKYYTPKELEYAIIPGIFLSPYEYGLLVEYKEELLEKNNNYVKPLPLKVFNYKGIYYSLNRELNILINDYFSLMNETPNLSSRFSSTFEESRIYSEIEGTLNVEDVPTTRKRLKELLEHDSPVKDKNDIIIKNMKKGIDFVNKLPPFNKDNLFKLYSILSKECLDKEDELKEGYYYRDDSVQISRYNGCPHKQIEECMNSLFNYVNVTIKSDNKIELLLLPHICHYYMIYIHPYFDYNGRTARMVSYWVYLLSGLEAFPPIVSEAINQTKKKYYEAIELSRDSHNDLTYFIRYLLSISIDYDICYQDLKHLEQLAKNKGYPLTETEINYVKKIFISYGGVFNYNDFLKMVNVSMSKQGALKLLNKLIASGVLVEVETSSKTKLFDINRRYVLYALRNFGYR